MQKIIDAIDKGTKAGLFNFQEVVDIARSLDQLNGILENHMKAQEALKNQSVIPEGPIKRDDAGVAKKAK